MSLVSMYFCIIYLFFIRLALSSSYSEYIFFSSSHFLLMDKNQKQNQKIFPFYYSHTAHGCILPTAPNNGRLVAKTDDSVKFLCDPSFIFPDTFQSSRTLYCTDRNTWHDSLPNCVGMFATESLSLFRSLANRNILFETLQFLDLAYVFFLFVPFFHSLRTIGFFCLFC